MAACKYGDKFCPCQDGDICHYEGSSPMTTTPSLRAALSELVAAEDASEQLAVEWRKAENWSGLDAARAVPIQKRIRNAWAAARTALAAGAAEPAWTFDTAFAAGLEAGKSMRGDRDHQWVDPSAASMERPAASGSEQDAARYQWLRKQMLWAPDGPASVKWIVQIAMPEPDISAHVLTADSTPRALDAGIDASMMKEQSTSITPPA